ncbi:MAG: hypothetical protein AAGG68_09095 [Bacteroidota bacterium]
MAKSEDYISVLCLYSQEDEEMKDLFERHFRLLHNRPEHYFDQIRYVAVERYTSYGITPEDIRLYTDVVVILLSANFLTSGYAQAAYRLSTLFKLHFQNNLFLVPVLLKACDWEATEFEKLDIMLPDKEHPVASDHWSHVDEALVKVAEDFSEIPILVREQKQKIESAWRRTTSSESIGSYDGFLRQFPLSRYREEAQAKRDELLENRLWKKANGQNTSAAYFEYLQDSPLDLHDEEARKKIIEIEASRDAAWQDAENNDELSFYLNYINRFPDNEERNEVAQFQVEEILNRPLDQVAHPDDLDDIQTEELKEEHHSFDTESNYLTYLTLQNLDSEELLSLILLIEYIEGASRRLGRIAGYLKGQIGQWKMIVSGLLLFFLLYVAAFLFYDTFDNASQFIKFGVPAIIIGLGLLILYYLIPEIEKDFKYVKRQQDLVRQKKVSLKMAYLQYDQFNKRAIIKEVLDAEKQATLISQKGLTSYFSIKDT